MSSILLRFLAFSALQTVDEPLLKTGRTAPWANHFLLLLFGQLGLTPLLLVSFFFFFFFWVVCPADRLGQQLQHQHRRSRIITELHFHLLDLLFFSCVTKTHLLSNGDFFFLIFFLFLTMHTPTIAATHTFFLLLDRCFFLHRLPFGEPEDEKYIKLLCYHTLIGSGGGGAQYKINIDKYM